MPGVRISAVDRLFRGRALDGPARILGAKRVRGQNERRRPRLASKLRAERFSETEDERQGVVDSTQLGGLEASRRAAEALGVDDGGLLHQDVRLGGVEGNRRPIAGWTGAVRGRREKHRAQPEQLVGLNGNRVAGAALLGAASIARRRQTKDLTANHLLGPLGSELGHLFADRFHLGPVVRVGRQPGSQATLNAFRVLRTERSLEEADAADARLDAGEGGPLLGVPIAIKDDVDLAGLTTPFGCGGEHDPATDDAEVVRRPGAAGAIVIGKTHAPEVGQWPSTESATFGVTRNPWSIGHTPGGSSGGAAAAVAGRLVAAAIGSDGAGSVRIPAAWTGLVGLKPQRWRISTWPEAEAFNGLTCMGPLARSVADAALLLDAVAGNRDGDLHQPPSL